MSEENKMKIPYKLKKAANVTVMIGDRQLFTGYLKAGTYNFDWDGCDSKGNPMPNGNYPVEITTNNITSKWDLGGNTSRDLTGTNKHVSMERMRGMLYAGGKWIYWVGYNEKQPSVFWFDPKKAQVKYTPMPGMNLAVMCAVADDKNIYFAGVDAGIKNGPWMVFALSIKDLTEAVLPGGVPYQRGTDLKYKSTILQSNTPITGLSIVNGQVVVDNTPKADSEFIAYGPNADYWKSEIVINRVTHYNKDGKYIEEIMWATKSYVLSLCGNDPTLLINNGLLFKIDYTEQKGWWQYIRNLNPLIPADYNNQYGNFKMFVKLPNGRYYVTLANSNPKNAWVHRIYELTDDGLRDTGKTLDMGTTQLYPDGSLRSLSRYAIGKPTVFSRKNLTGFDADNNPIWEANWTITEQTPPATAQDPGLVGDITNMRTGEVTESGWSVIFDASRDDKYHLALVKDGKMIRMAPATFKEYKGNFPNDGSYDIGNNPNNSASLPGTIAVAYGNLIFQHSKNEFWKNSQANRCNIFDDTGAFLCQLGTDGWVTRFDVCPAGMAGNVMGWIIVKGTDGKIYAYHQDESIHGAFHRWEILGLDTIQKTVVQAVINEPDLHIGLPFNSQFVPVAGWDSNMPTVIKTGVKSLSRTSPDLYIDVKGVPDTLWLSKTLGKFTGLQNWTLSSIINWNVTALSGGKLGAIDMNNAVVFDILGTNSEVLVRIAMQAPVYKGDASLMVNGVEITKVSDMDIRRLEDHWEPITVSMAGGVLSAGYGGKKAVKVPVTGDIGSPGMLKLTMKRASDYHVGLSEFRFEV